ncbi:MAG: hypothetical protein QM733_00550 [Ilumatobacteraceae bacterium]
MDDRRRAATNDRRPAAEVVVAFVVGLIALVGGCASSSGGAATTAVGATSTSLGATTSVVAPTTVAATTAAPATPTGGGTTATPSATAPIDPTATLQSAIAALGGSYHFATTVTVDGAVVATAEGDHIDDGTRMALTANGATVQYVITADNTWVEQEGQGWQQLDDPPATTDPVAALAAPTSVELVGSDGTTTTLRVSVPSTALGIPGDGDVPVTAVMTGGTLTSVAYDSTVGSKPANVTATLGPPADPSPVTAPA